MFKFSLPSLRFKTGFKDCNLTLSVFRFDILNSVWADFQTQVRLYVLVLNLMSNFTLLVCWHVSPDILHKLAYRENMLNNKFSQPYCQYIRINPNLGKVHHTFTFIEEKNAYLFSYRSSKPHLHKLMMKTCFSSTTCIYCA